MTLPEIEQDFKRKVCAELSLESRGTGQYLVETPFTFDDGDHLTIVLRNRDGEWVLTDEGNTYMHLSYDIDEKALTEGNRQKIIADTLACFGVEDLGGELSIPVKDGEYGNALYDFVQALLRISDLTFLSREQVAAVFEEDFLEFFSERLPEERRESKWHHPTYDPEGHYPADWHINGADRPTVIYGLNTDASVMAATISLQVYEKWEYPVRSLGIFADQEKISRRPLAQFTNVCDRQFSSLSGDVRDRIDKYLREELRVVS